MAGINSSDYHDFVIKNGRLIGAFDEMYRKSKELPWHQDKQKGALDLALTIEILRRWGPFDYICDFGCGLGYFLDILKSEVGVKKCRLIGYDISPTCCAKAKKLFPGVTFKTLDLTSKNIKIEPAKEKEVRKRLFVIRATLWYVFPKIKTVVKNIAQHMDSGDYLLVCQNFPPLKSDFVGKDVFPEPESVVEVFKKHFTPLKSVWSEDRISQGNDNWFICVFVRN